MGEGFWTPWPPTPRACLWSFLRRNWNRVVRRVTFLSGSVPVRALRSRTGLKRLALWEKSKRVFFVNIKHSLVKRISSNPGLKYLFVKIEIKRYRNAHTIYPTKTDRSNNSYHPQSSGTCSNRNYKGLWGFCLQLHRILGRCREICWHSRIPVLRRGG